jgi:hypothetical protein
MPSLLWIENIDDDTFRTVAAALFGPARKSGGNGGVSTQKTNASTRT